MKILAIDTASNTATAAVAEDEVLLAETVLNHKKTHSQKIMVMVEQMLNDLETDVSDIDVFAAAVGPGSFTGLRIGIATIKGLAHSVEKPVVGVSTLEALAYELPFSDGLIVPIMDARRGQVFNAAYFYDNGRLCELIPPNACDISECVKKAAESDYYNLIFTGDGVNVHTEYIKSTVGERALFAPPNIRTAHAAATAYAAYLKARNGETIKYSELVPEYLRLSQAEQELEKKKKLEEKA